MAQYLIAGQIGDPTVVLPGGAGAKLWILSPLSFGGQVASTGGSDSLLRYDSDDYAITGDGGRTRARRLYVKVGFDGPCLVRFTPRIDFQTLLTGSSWTLTPLVVGQRTVKVIDLVIARVASYLGLQAEVVTRSGRFQVLGLSCAHQPLAGAATSVAGSEAAT